MESETAHKAQQLSLAGAATSIIFVATTTSFVAKKYAYRDKTHTKNIFFVTKLLSRQIFVVEGAQIMFVATNISCDKSFVATNIILYRQMFYRDKHTFIATKDVFCHSTGRHDQPVHNERPGD